ncbi:MAG: carbon-nitrogen hydrolase family protein [Deltaproteobacteria bacterium]|nr:carbon-nitrogen hydrolase family protein [Deltaproteobacteria bacterium]
MSFKIGVGQMNSRDDKAANLTMAEKLIDKLAERGARLIMLPEYFLFLGDMPDIARNAEPADGPSLDRIREKAVSHKVYIHCGSFPEKNGGKTYNTSVVFNPDGFIVAVYRKIHLFDVELPNGNVYRESDTFTPGSRLVTFQIDGITFGMSICYDLRFPELYRQLNKQGAQVLLVPAAFTLETGRDHWELLLRTRAVDNLCWVVAAGQWGPHPPHKTCYGRSLVVNPWGLVVAKATDGISHLTAEIDVDMIAELKATFPVVDHHREDLFRG